MTSTPVDDIVASGPVVIAYDGSELAGYAISQAAGLLGKGQDALVLCVWQPADVGFVVPKDAPHFDADQAGDVRHAAEQTAAHGASLADQAGFHSQSLAVESSPTWQGIVDAAEKYEASVVVLGSHRRGGLKGHLLGSVAAAVVARFSGSVLVVHHKDAVSR